MFPEGYRPTVAEIAMQSALGHMTEEYEADLAAARARIEALESFLREKADELQFVAENLGRDFNINHVLEIAAWMREAADTN